MCKTLTVRDKVLHRIVFMINMCVTWLVGSSTMLVFQDQDNRAYCCRYCLSVSICVPKGKLVADMLVKVYIQVITEGECAGNY